MQIYPDKLAAQLKQSLGHAYLVAGDDALLQNDACELIRDAAAAQGYVEIQRCVQDSSFSWPQWLARGNELSLFGDKRLLELRLSTAKIGTEGSAALCKYLDDPPPDTVLLVSCPRPAGKPKWLGRFSSDGVYVPIYPLAIEQLPQWLMRRAQRYRLKLSGDAAVLLAERVEGNMMAAVQELEKLSLTHSRSSTGKSVDNANGNASANAADSTSSSAGKIIAIDAATIATAVTDSARFSAFDMLDHALKQNAVAACRALAHVREEGQDPAALLGATSYELRRLGSLLEYQRQNRLPAGLKALRVIASKQAMLNNAIARLTADDLERCIRLAARADLLSKRGGSNLAFTLLEMILLRLAGRPLATEAAVLDEAHPAA